MEPGGTGADAGGTIAWWIGAGAVLAALAVVAVALAVAVRVLRRGRVDRLPRTVPGPRGEMALVPVRRISAGSRGAPWDRIGGLASLRIHPDRIEYRALRRRVVPLAEVAQVDAPVAGRPYFTVGFGPARPGIGVLAESEYALRYALWRLSAACPLTDRAAARITA